MGFASIERQGSIVRAFVLTFGVRADLYDYVVVVAFFLKKKFFCSPREISSAVAAAVMRLRGMLRLISLF